MIKNTKGILPQLNIIRAIASLAVAIFHLGGKSIPGLNYGWLGVQMFFVLTGFVICWSLPEKYKINQFPNFLLRRLVRIEPPYIFSILLIFIFSYFIHQNTEKIDTQNVILHLAYINNFFDNNYLSPVYWTLGIEFQFYIFIGLLFPVLTSSKYTAILLLILLNILSFYWRVEQSFVLNFISYFSLGILVYMFKTFKLAKPEFYLLILSLFIYMFINIGISQTVASLVTCMIILYLKSSNFIIDFFSKISFSLYLTHDTIGSSLVIFIGNLFNSKNILTKALAFSIGMSAAILFAYLFYILIEKKAIIYSKKFKYIKQG